MKYCCTKCLKAFNDPVLDQEIQSDALLLLDYINENAIICAECATDSIRLSSSTNLHTRSARNSDVSRETK